MCTILMVEDEQLIVDMVSDYLESKGYTVYAAYDGKEAIRQFIKYNKEISLVLLDIMVPKKWGFDILKEIREVSDVPIIFLTAISSEEYELEALECGADDYIKKPFKLNNLEIKIKMVLRRMNDGNLKDTSDVTAIKIDKVQKYIIENGRVIKATSKEIEVLEYFISHKGQTISREKLLNKIWGIDYIGTERTVDTVIKQLRAKLKDKKYIYTVSGVGYKYED